MTTVILNEEIKEELSTLKDDEKFTFSLKNKEFVIINKSEYNKLQVKENAFDLIYKLKIKDEKKEVQ